MVKVNGQDLDVAGKTISELLEIENYNVKHIVVERNYEILPKTDYDKIVIEDADCIEVISFMGGG